MVNEQIFSSVASSPIFSKLSPELIRANISHFNVKNVEEGDVILAEGQKNQSIHIIHSGEAHVVKMAIGQTDAHVIATLSPGQEIGEMTVMDNSEASATVLAAKPMELISLDLSGEDHDEKLQELCDQLQLQIGRRIASRLRDTNSGKVEVMEREVRIRREQAVAGRFAITILTLVACYTIALRAILDLNVYSWMEVYYSPLIIVAFMLAMVYMMIRSAMPLEAFGVTFKNGFKASADAIKYSLLFCVFLTGCKWLYIAAQSDAAALSVFQTADMFSSYDESGRFEWTIYFLFMVAYALLCPVQELIGRCGVQAPLYIFLQGSEGKRHFLSILVSNLMYAASHSHLNLSFAVVTFIPGLFWGWLFMRHKSLVGVSVSHAIIGCYALFALGLEEFLK